MKRIILSIVWGLLTGWAAVPCLWAQSRTGTADREIWVKTLVRLADPVLSNLANETLKKEMPYESLAPNRQRFSYPLQAVGVEDETLAEKFSEDFFAIIPTKSGLMPYAKEVLEYLAPKYNLYILSNGFRELQSRKMRSAGVDIYFKKVILSEDLGVLKPWPEIFNFALSATQSELRESLMIGDSWEADITGAHGIGMHQAFYNVTGRTSFPFQPTYHIYSLKDLIDLL